MFRFLGKAHAQVVADIFKYVGPGLLVTVGFIDPGNWATNVAAGSQYGYHLLWVVTLSTIMLVFLQHNAAHLGIATGYCLSEAATIFLKPWIARSALGSAYLATIATAMAELLGGAIALQMLFGLPVKAGVLLLLAVVSALLISNSYSRLEKVIIGFVSLIGLSFVFELYLVQVDWGEAVRGWLVPTMPPGSVVIIMGVLGAVVMPHNLFLHSEIIQSRQWNVQEESVITHQLKFEFVDTLFSMGVGWAINSAMVILAAATFFRHGTTVAELGQADAMLRPLVGGGATMIFAVALLFAGVASSITAGMSGGCILAGMYGEPYSSRDSHTRFGVGGTLVLGAIVILFIDNPFRGLILSQVCLSIQLPVTVFLQLYLTSSRKVMGKYANDRTGNIILWSIALIVTGLNLMLLWQFVTGL